MDPEDIFEEEQVRLASEISLFDEDLDFDPLNIEETKDKVRLLEEIVDVHFVASDVPANYGEPMTESQIRDLFALSDVVNEPVTQNETKLHGKFTTPSKSKVQQHHPLSGRRPSGRGREQKIKDTVLTISQKLKSYKSKIVQTIQSQSQANESDSLATLLELNDRVSNALNKAEIFSKSTYSSDVYPYLSRHNSDSPSFVLEKDKDKQQSIVSMVYDLRRGGDRNQTMIAVSRLMNYCNFGGEVKVPIVKEMMEAGALQSLLSTLTRTGDWPEVEIQISKIISVLVTYEDDWALLQRSAYVILSSLYTLQLKTQARTKVYQEAHNNNSNHHHRGISEVSNTTTEQYYTLDDDETTITNTNNNAASSSLSSASHKYHRLSPHIEGNESNLNTSASAATLLDEQQQQEIIRANMIEQQATQDIRALVSAAIAKLSLVLSCEWGKLETPLGAGSIFANHNSGAGIAIISNTSVRSGSNATRPRSFSNSEPTRILDILVNLILTLCEGTAIATPHNTIAMSESQDTILTYSTSGVFSVPSKSNSFANFANHQQQQQQVISSSSKNSSLHFHSDISNNERPNSKRFNAKDLYNIQQQSQPYSGVNGSSNNSGFPPSIPHKPEPLRLQNPTSIAEQLLSYTTISVDSAAVLCSAALSNLAEVSQCRPGLVSGGALKLIKAWLEIGIETLSQARALCFNSLLTPNQSSNSTDEMRISSSGSFHNKDSNNINDTSDKSRRPSSKKYVDSYSNFMKTFGSAYELLSNAAAALMYISGGKDCRYQSLNIEASSNPLHGGGGRDYIVGWIDAQILAEGLPAVIVKLILTGVEDFTCLDSQLQHNTNTNTNSSSKSKVKRPHDTRSVLPAAVGMHLSQVLYQLCSRMANRQQLQTTNIPFALCVLFENIINQVKQRNDRENTSSHNNKAEESIFDSIFDFGGIYYQGTHASSATHCADWESNSDLMSLYSTSIEDKNFLRLSLNPRYSGQHSAISGSGKSPTPSTHTATGNNTNTTGVGNNNNKVPATPQQQNHDNTLLIMASITSSCLDALTYFFADEVAKLPYSNTSNKQDIITNPLSSCGSPSSTQHLSNSNNGSFSNPLPMIDLMCHPRMINSILLASSFLPRGLGRLAAIRIISSLTEFPQSLNALYDGSVIDVLVLISSEAEEAKAIKSLGSKTIERDETNTTTNNTSSLYPTTYPGKPTPVERNVSGGSSLSGGGSSNSQHRPRDISMSLRSSTGRTTPIEEDEEEEERRTAEIAVEEALTVCYSLANMCQANEAYAQRMFNSGLFQIMIRLVKSSHMEISRQALRCMSAMCPVISSETLEKAVFVKPKKNALFLEALDALTIALKSPSPLVQKGAAHTISKLALINDQIQDSIVEGPLRSIVGILVNPRNDRELRAAAEDVLKNVGFLGGVKDFELCGFDFEILHDWHAMKRSLRPQEQGLDILKQWIENLFNNSTTTNELMNLHHQHNDAELSAHGLANEAVNILLSSGINVNSTSVTPLAASHHSGSSGVNNTISPLTSYHHGHGHNASNEKIKEGSSSLKSSSHEHLPMPQLHRRFTDSFFKFLPFCGPKASPAPPPAVTASSSFENNNSFMSSMTMNRHHSNDGHSSFESKNLLSGGNPTTPPSANHMNRSLVPTSNNNNDNNNKSHPLLFGHHQSSFTTVHHDDSYDWLDRPPLGVMNLLELFYTSKLHHNLLMDLTSLGVNIVYNNTIPNDNESVTNSKVTEETNTTAELDETLMYGSTSMMMEDGRGALEDQELIFLMPRPHAVSAILLPSRTYQSFARVGRVLEKMFEYAESNKMWSLTFRDSEYLGDFHTTLLATLRKCPQICSVSFSSNKRVESDALLGHLVGQIPSNVRFLSFKSTLSKESIQALCILLKSHNAAFIAPLDGDMYGNINNNNNNNSSGYSNNHKSKRFHPYYAGKTMATPPASKIDISNSKGLPKESSPRLHPYKGLLGLALTHLSFESSEITYIMELLQPPKVQQRNSSFRKVGGTTTPVIANATTVRKSTSSNTGDITPNSLAPSTPNVIVNNATNIRSKDHMRGLKFIDLSHNNLHDTNAAKILLAGISGPLEGIDLTGNSIHKAAKIIEVLEQLTPDKIVINKSKLRYLGLAQNGLSKTAITSLLSVLAENESITYLDLSSNDIDHSREIHEILRKFLIHNVGLRSLDLCYNKLNSDSFKEIHLGLLENETMLMLPLAGNPQVNDSMSINMIQLKLRENRLLYKAHTRDNGSFYDPVIATPNAMLSLKLSAINEEEGVRLNNNSSDDIQLASAFPVLENPNNSSNSVNSNNNNANTHEATGIAGNKNSHSKSNTSHLKLFDPNTTTGSSNNMKLIIDTRNNSSNNNNSDIDTGRSDINPNNISPTLAIAVPVDSSIAAETAVTTTAIKVNNDTINTHSHTVSLHNNNSSSHLPQPGAHPLARTNSYGSNKSHHSNNSKDNKGQGPPSLQHLNKDGHVMTNTTTLSTLENSTSDSSIVDVSLSHENIKLHNSKMGIASPINNIIDSTKDNNNTSTQIPAQSSATTSTNTLNVFFSAPLAGFDRNQKSHPLEVLDYSAERDILIQVFKEVHRDISVHFDFATTDSLRTALSFNCKALHFSGHGIPKGLCFEDGRGGLQVIRVPQLKDLLGAGGLHLEFVFVSACYSKEIGEAFVKAGVPHVVCVKIDSKIQDAAAIAFTRAFYVAFLSGRTVKHSFDIAKEALKASPYVPDSVLEGEKFILLPESSWHKQQLTANEQGTTAIPLPLVSTADGDTLHNKIIFSNRPISDWPIPGHCTMGPNRTDVNKFKSRNRLPAPPADFEGREVIMHTLIRNIMDRRLVSLVGEDGAGKTSTAAAVCKYIADREIFPDSVVFLRAKGLKDYRSFLIGLQQAFLSSGTNSVAKKMQTILANSITTSTNLVYPEEEHLFACLETMKLLLVIDNIDDLVADYGESVTDLRLFLGRLFEQCPHVKMLVVSTDTLSMHNINVGSGIIEYSVPLGPLSLNSSLRLFARLAPSLSTAQAKTEFIEALQPSRQQQYHGSNTGMQILGLFGDGHPAKIVHMACESTPESVEKLKLTGLRVIRESMPFGHIRSTTTNQPMLSTSTASSTTTLVGGSVGSISGLSNATLSIHSIFNNNTHITVSNNSSNIIIITRIISNSIMFNNTQLIYQTISNASHIKMQLVP